MRARVRPGPGATGAHWEAALAVLARRAATVLALLTPALAFSACGTTDEASRRIDDPVPIDGGAVPAVFINEVAPTNTRLTNPATAATDDWIELYNGGDTDAELEGYFVSDNPGDLQKARLPAEAVVPALDVLVLWAGGTGVSGVLSLPFGLSASGESVCLSTPAGELMDSVVFGMASQDWSYARFPDGTGDWQWCASPSQGAHNGLVCGE